MVALASAYSQVVNRVLALLRQELTPTGRLPEVREIVDGERYTHKPTHPAVWVWPDNAENVSETFLAETWELTLFLAAVCFNPNDPVAGQRLAQDIVLRARAVLLRDRRLGLTFVLDTKSVNFLPNRNPQIKNNLYSAGVTMSITFKILEGRT